MNYQQQFGMVDDQTKTRNLRDTLMRRKFAGLFQQSISETEEAENRKKESEEKFRAQLDKSNASEEGTNRQWMYIGHFMCGMKPLTPWEETFSLFFLHCYCMEIHPRCFTLNHARDQPKVEEGFLKNTITKFLHCPGSLLI